MKKLLILSISLFSFFAIQNANADCYFNYPYNGQYVTYCYGDNYNSGDNNYYNYYNSNYNYDYSRYDNYYRSDRTNEENYYNLLYMNGIELEDSSKKKVDFFKDNVVSNDKEFSMLDEISLGNYKFKSATYNSKYSDAQLFIKEIKSITKEKYLMGEITYNEIYDIINDLDFLVDNLNNQFKYYKKYESTGNSMYKDLATESGTQVRTNYNKLKFTLNNL